MVYFFHKTRNLTEEEQSKAMLFLDAGRKAKVAVYKNIEKQQDCILVYLLLRYGLYQEYKLRQAPCIMLDAQGKPQLQWLDYQFNFSHDHGACVCALSKEPIGVDVQKTTSVRASIVRRIFSQKERESVGENQPSDVVFTSIWTRKEAYGKAIGKGICYDMDRTDVSTSCTIDGMQLQTQYIGAYCLSTCAVGEQGVVIVTWEELMSVMEKLV